MNFLDFLKSFGSDDSESVSNQIPQKDERPKPAKCILCGGLLRLAAEGRNPYCTSGHEALYWMGDNKWFTRDDDVGQRLQAKGFKVMSAPPACAPGTRYFIET
jgi:hypothetical protein